jgi:broad specificity phosphatase PhoE
MVLVYLVQHGEKEHLPGDPGLTDAGRQQAAADLRATALDVARAKCQAQVRRRMSH